MFGMMAEENLRCLDFPMGQFLKRTADIFISLAILLLLSPLLLVLAAWIAISSPGPIFFRQARLGRKGKPFQILKYRTMVVNAPDLRNPDGSAFSGDQDPRVTKPGRLLRATSLDEIPQFFNVLKGEMSLVGPRPDLVDQLQYYTDDERKKLNVKPGITGLAQISGRNSISWADRKKLDIQYVQTWSLWQDFVICLKTVPYVLLRRDVNATPGESK
jgi:lipopolysaccharide/colanic/teichoic acid biosynthesis glycosyltransferase